MQCVTSKAWQQKGTNLNNYKTVIFWYVQFKSSISMRHNRQYNCINGKEVNNYKTKLYWHRQKEKIYTFIGNNVQNIDFFK